MANWTKKEILSHKGLLDGTIENHECDPQMDCEECGGNGQCVTCHGSGEVKCKKCNGTGRCTDCHGEGSHRCNQCGGTGTCRRCGGSGRITCTKCNGTGQTYENGKYIKCYKCGGRGSFSCPDCTSGGKKVAKGLTSIASLGIIDLSGSGHGDGKCQKCDGTGRITCKKCHGSGDCPTCNGSGLVSCHHCNGTGHCPTCNGTGKVTCKRCKGSGWYQTFQTYLAKCYSMQWNYYSSEILEPGLKLAMGEQLYRGIYKKWKSKNVISIDDSSVVQNNTNTGFGNTNTYSTFLNNYSKAIASSGVNDNAYSKSVEIVKVAVSKIDFRLNNKDYSIYILGNNGVVMYDELPKEVKMYKPSFWQNLYMKLTRKKRHIALIKMAAYIFQCDGKSMDESHILSVFLNELALGEKKKLAFKDKLNTYNSNMPYEVFFKQVKCLFKSKKALTFAWQCMAVDKQVSAREVELFDKMVKEFKNIESSEVEDIKRFASKYSLLKDESLVKEYLM